MLKNALSFIYPYGVERGQTSSCKKVVWLMHWIQRDDPVYDPVRVSASYGFL